MASLKILHKNKALLQYKQIFQSGEENAILKLPSEKMLVGERITAACTRLLKEELSIEGTFVFKYIDHKQEITSAYAYPGIFNSLNLYYYETLLPNEYNVLENYEEVNSKQITYFKWFEQRVLTSISL